MLVLFWVYELWFWFMPSGPSGSAVQSNSQIPPHAHVVCQFGIVG